MRSAMDFVAHKAEAALDLKSCRLPTAVHADGVAVFRSLKCWKQYFRCKIPALPEGLTAIAPANPALAVVADFELPADPEDGETGLTSNPRELFWEKT